MLTFAVLYGAASGNVPCLAALTIAVMLFATEPQ